MAESIKTMKLYRDVDRVHNELRELGLGSGPLQAAQVSAFDQYHYGGTDAVSTAVELCGFKPGMHVLDVGSGLGGPARYLATTAGLHVTAVELQADVHEEAAVLTTRCELGGLVKHVCGDILAPETRVGEGLDGLVSWLTFLHIADRGALLSRCFRALRPGARVYIEDYAAGPGMTDADRSTLREQVACPYLPSVDQYCSQMEAAGFAAVRVTDLTAEWTQFVRERLAAFRGARERHVRVHGETVVKALDEFYAAVDRLFDGGNLFGVRVLAQKPE